MSVLFASSSADEGEAERETVQVEAPSAHAQHAILVHARRTLHIVHSVRLPSAFSDSNGSDIACGAIVSCSSFMAVSSEQRKNLGGVGVLAL